MQILVTGGSGFIGRYLVDWLVGQGHSLSCVVRRGSRLSPIAMTRAVAPVPIDDIANESEWASKLRGKDAVVHLAARVHVMEDAEADPLASYRSVNLHGTQRLAEAAVAAGVKRFVYISSIKVNGECTHDRPFHADDQPAPADPYAISKLEAEQQLWRLAADFPTEFVVIRPPLVYGPGVKGNFERLVRLVMSGLPLPLAALRNRRSMVSVDNLVDFIGVCLVHPKAAGQVFLVSDGSDWSTPQLVRAIAAELPGSPRLFAIPPGVLKVAAGLLGRRALIDRLSESLQVDIGKNRELLQWRPMQSPSQAVQRTVLSIVDEARP